MPLMPSVSAQDHARGPLWAPVVLVHYGDFECPYSGALFSVLQDAKNRMGDDLCLIFRTFPLPDLHPHALMAALAAEAAADKFWPMHDLLYENQNALTDQDLRDYAAALEMDGDTFWDVMNAAATRALVEKSVESGHRSGAHGTPSVFINGAFHDNDQALWHSSALMPLLEAARGQNIR